MRAQRLTPRGRITPPCRWGNSERPATTEDVLRAFELGMNVGTLMGRKTDREVVDEVAAEVVRTEHLGDEAEAYLKGVEDGAS